MKNTIPIVLGLTILFYSAMIILTEFSLTGFWTDILFSSLLLTLAIRITFRCKTEPRVLRVLLRTIALCFSLVVVYQLNPFMTIFFADTFKTRTFYFIQVDNRLFNAQFKPVGAYSGG